MKIAIPTFKRKAGVSAALLMMLSFNAFSSNVKNRPLVETELKGAIIFSNQPFEGDSPTAKPVTAFKAWDEIYGRIQFAKPLKNMLTGYFAGAILDEGSIIVFELKREVDGEIHHGVSKNLSKADLEKNYIDFDIAPGINKSRDAFTPDFSGGVTSLNNPDFENRTNSKFTMRAFFWDAGHEEIPEQYISGTLSIDYSGLPDGDDGISKMSEWERAIYQAAQEDKVAENVKKRSIKPTIEFSTLPFSNASHTVVSSIKAGDQAYGRITLAKPLKEFIQEGNPKQIQIDIKCLNDELTGIAVTKKLSAAEFNNAYIDFDINPNAENAKDVYTDNMGFYFTIFQNGLNPKKKLKFEISLATDYNISNNGFRKMVSFGELEIDYSAATAAQIAEWNTNARKMGEIAEKNADKVFAKECMEAVKNLPMPTVFTVPSKAGYTGYSNATIIQMIKTYYKVSEVLMLTFDEPEGTGDFRSLTDLNNYPSEKLGTHVFYFVFKDNDGAYKFAGGRLRMLYEGYGKYSEAFIHAYSPFKDGELFPWDRVRDKAGFQSVFYMPESKIRK
jgi:hypothetical protein